MLLSIFSFVYSPAYLRGRVMLATLFALMTLTVLLFSTPFARSDSDDVNEVRQADFLFSDSDALPSASDTGWHSVILPELWSRIDRVNTGGWYRLRIPLTHLPQQLQGVYLFRLNMNAAMYLNGEFLGSGGRMSEPLALNWNHPIYAPVPQALWRVGDNELLIHLKTYPGFGMMSAPQIGADEVLQPRYEWRRYLQNELTQVFSVVLVMVGMFALGLWMRRRNDSIYLWLGLSSFCWALFNTWLFVRYPPLSFASFQWVTHVALDFWMVCLVAFMHRYLQLRREWLERALMGVQAILATIFGVLPRITGYAFIHIAHTITLLMAVYLSVLAWRRWYAQSGGETFSIASAFSALVLAGLHDWLMENTIPGLLSWETLVTLWRHQFHLLFFMVPALLLVLTWHLTLRFARALNEAEQLNQHLESRVQAAQLILAKGFEDRHLLELKQATASERERIYRDLHDDVGAKLLGLAISAQRADLPREADLARSALQDLRDVVSRSSQSFTPLGYLVADWRAETEQRLQPTGIALDWSIPLEDLDMLVSTETALNLSRILRESITNVLRHAQASQIAIHTELIADRLMLTVQDNGRGFVLTETRTHRGMTSMQSRADTLGAEIAWECVQPQGCRVTLLVPLAHLAQQNHSPLNSSKQP